MPVVPDWVTSKLITGLLMMDVLPLKPIQMITQAVVIPSSSEPHAFRNPLVVLPRPA